MRRLTDTGRIMMLRYQKNLPFGDEVSCVEGGVFHRECTGGPYPSIGRQLVAMRLVAAQRLIAPELEVARIDVGRADPV